MKAAFHERNCIVDAGGRLVANDHGFNKLPPAARPVLADGKCRRHDFAGVQWLGAEISIVEVERADQHAVDEGCSLYSGRTLLTDDRGVAPVPKYRADGFVG